jgi:hypothetical protein
MIDSNPKLTEAFARLMLACIDYQNREFERWRAENERLRHQEHQLNDEESNDG